MIQSDGLRKGGDLLVKALQAFRSAPKLRPAVVLRGRGGDRGGGGIPALNLGYVSSDRLKAIAYCAADSLSCHPSDNLAVGFWRAWPWHSPGFLQVGGVRSLSAQASQVIWPSRDANDLYNGIIQLLEDKALRKAMGQQCRAIASRKYPLELQVPTLPGVYSHVLANARHDVLALPRLR